MNPETGAGQMPEKYNGPEKVTVPDNIDVNFDKAIELFRSLCREKAAPLDRSSFTPGTPYGYGKYKSAEVRLYGPRLSEARRDEIVLSGESAALPKIRFMGGNREDLEELLELFRQQNIIVELT